MVRCWCCRTEREEVERAFQPPPTLIQLDGPKHTAYRKIISKRFTPGALRKIHHEIEQIAREIVESLLGEGDEGACDFVEKVAAPLPIAVIAWLLGVPKSDWKLLFDWTNRTIGSADPEYQVEGQTPAETSQKAMTELFMYFAKLVEEKRKQPADDLVSLFVSSEVDGKPLPPLDLLSYCMIIVVAGNETTRNATSGGMAALHRASGGAGEAAAEPGAARLRDRGDAALGEPDHPLRAHRHRGRRAARPAHPRGRPCGLFYPSANRDEEVFERPFEFRIDRNPNRHLGVRHR